MATFTIRIPDEMRDRIKAAADEDRRSMNGEIEWLLGSSLDRRENGWTEPPTDKERLDALMRGLTDDRLRLNYDKASECPGTEWHQTLLAELHRRGLTAEEQQ
jgi:hypothetical protein